MIRLDPRVVEACPPGALDETIRRTLGSVQYEFVPDACAIRLLGPDMRYHELDRDLQATLHTIRADMSTADILPYLVRRQRFDLCLEDSWSGYFIADRVRKRPQDLVVIHVDDHMDMMPTLLVVDDGRLICPESGMHFDPDDPRHWVSAIQSGCVGIGNFLTPLCYADRKVHVRHLNNATSDTLSRWDIHRHRLRYPQIPDLDFAGIGSGPDGADSLAGSYMGGSCPEAVLRDLPAGAVIVHIDLDWFINDFNGNASQAGRVADDAAVALAHRKVTDLFAAVDCLRSRIEGWIVATSPGFCAAAHWPWLLDEIDRGIAQIGGTA